jgi:hypothetical protein
VNVNLEQFFSSKVVVTRLSIQAAPSLTACEAVYVSTTALQQYDHISVTTTAHK